MTSEPRAATIKATSSELVCFVFSRSTFEDIISGSNELIGSDNIVKVDWSKDHETRSLFKHMENIMDIIQGRNSSLSPKISRILYELTTAITPELSTDDIIARMVMTVRVALQVDRVGLFVLTEDKRSLILKASERGRGIRLPVRGIAGAILQTNSIINITDAYQDPRFDATMDRRLRYRTKQILGVPLRHPLSGEAIGLLQVNNRVGKNGQHIDDAFDATHVKILETAAGQFAELLHGRADVFIHSGIPKGNVGAGVSDGLALLNTSDLDNLFQVKVFSFMIGGAIKSAIRAKAFDSLQLEVSLFQALTPLCPSQFININIPSSLRGVQKGKQIKSKQNESVSTLNVEDVVELNIFTRDIPRASRLMVRLIGVKNISKKQTECMHLAWLATNLFDYKGCLDSVKGGLGFFEGYVDAPATTTLSNCILVGEEGFISSVSLVLAPDVILGGDSYHPRVKVIHTLPVRTEPLDIGDNLEVLKSKEKEELERILQLSFNPLGMELITDNDREFLWDIRYRILHRAELLPAFAMSIEWHEVQQVQELYDLLDLWESPSPAQALQLLDRRFMDPKIRAFAAHCLEDLSDQELSLYMLQLCQQLKFENYVDSALARFLLRRALANQKLIGHIFFWFLQSELHNVDVSRRFAILLQTYLTNCSEHRVELGQQMFIMKKLEHVAHAVALGESKSMRKQILKDRLSEIVLPAVFKLPLNPSLEICGIDVARCRVMESKKKPLWLTLKSAKGDEDIVLMLKVGDDLRQDALILQLLRVMDSLWRAEGLEMQMQLYDCISTGDERGLLQVVQNSNTVGNILAEATDMRSKAKVKSGSMGRKLRAAFRAISDFNFLGEWIEMQVCNENHDVDDEVFLEEEKEHRVQNFVISTAAYCVASYVLGLGDRHNDNLMMTKKGHFFHIDFGHILGNFKSKLGVKRERAPFVFTPAMKSVMSTSDDQFELFVDLCCDIYNILRENATLLVSLCSLAIPCNLPELQTEKDLMWLYDKLLIGKTDEEASEDFRKQIDISLRCRTTRFNDAAHMIAHA